MAFQPNQPNQPNQLNPEKLRQLVNSIFEKYDKDKNFTLEVAEVQAIVADSTGKPVTEEQAKYFLEAVDSNKDGKVSKMELYRRIGSFVQK